jgi:lipid-A-disaccharide synthase
LDIHWRDIIYYPLGLLPVLFFTARFLIQWILSEKAQRSIVPTVFWKLSIAGNTLQSLHYFLQFQYPIAWLQSSNAWIAWRNLDLMKGTKGHSRSFALSLLGWISFGVIVACYVQEMVFPGAISQRRVDFANYFESPSMFLWHAFGFGGQALFASRFWLQWRQAERSGKSELSALFWKISLSGSVMSLIYFIHIQAIISILNNGFALVPYIRNLILLRRQKESVQRLGV